jgi:hypothetical protein
MVSQGELKRVVLVRGVGENASSQRWDALNISRNQGAVTELHNQAAVEECAVYLPQEGWPPCA